MHAQLSYRLAVQRIKPRRSLGRVRSERLIERFRRASARFVWCLLFGLFVAVRYYHLDKAPPHNATTDEYAWTWSGMSLLETGTPKAWSNLLAYKPRRKVVHWRNHKYFMVKPWLDHPPVYSLYAGTVMRVQGQRDPFEVDLRKMRYGTLLLDAISFVLLTWLLRKVASWSEVLCSLLMFSVLPLVVLHQRLVISENLVVPLTLGALICLMGQRQRLSISRSALLFLLSVLLPLTKVAALSASVFLTMWSLSCTDRRIRFVHASNVALGTCLGVASYLAWGRHFDPALFSEVMTNHHDRFKGFAGLTVLLFEPQLINKHVKDLLSVAGCVLALASLAEPRPSLWGLAVLSYAGCMAFFVDEHRVFGWYFIPLYPWLCAALGVTIARASRERHVGLSLLWCTLAGLSVATVLHRHRLFETVPIRWGYLAGILAIYGGWLAWPRVARVSIPAINSLMLAAATWACLYDVYTR